MSNVTIHTWDRCGAKSEGFPSGWMYLREFFGDFKRDLCYECKEKLFCFMKKKPYKD